MVLVVKTKVNMFVWMEGQIYASETGSVKPRIIVTLLLLPPLSSFKLSNLDSRRD